MDPLKAQLRDTDRRVRLTAVKELSARDDDKAAELLNLALDDGNRMVRFQAMEGLSAMGNRRALQLLLARMDDDSQPTMLRRFALNAVVAIGTPEAADALEARMETYSSGRARRVVARKIAKMRKQNAT